MAYVVAAWLFIQALEIATDAFDAPSWVMQLALLVVAIGILPTAVIAWIYEFTPSGVTRDEEIPPVARRQRRKTRGLDLAVVVLLLFGVALYFGLQTLPEESHSSIWQAVDDNQTPVLAVLPFVTRGADQQALSVADGLHDDLLTQLAKLDAIKVISRTSVMEYRDTTKNVRQIGEELNANLILEGGLQQAGQQLRVNAQLIDARTDQHLWAETFDRELSTANLFAIQGEIAASIARSLDTTLSIEQSAATSTNSLDAWQALTRGRMLASDRSRTSMQQRIAQFEQAIELDPGFALAHAQLALALFEYYWEFRELQFREKGLFHQQQARELDPELAELAFVDGLANYWLYLDYEASLEAFDKAIAKIPNDADLLGAQALVLRGAGRWDAALQQFEKAHQLDPRRRQWLLELTRTHRLLRNFDLAGSYAEQLQRLAPDWRDTLQQQALLQAACCGEQLMLQQLLIASEDVELDRDLLDAYLLAGQVGLLGERYQSSQAYRETRTSILSAAFVRALVAVVEGHTEQSREDIATFQSQAANLVKTAAGDFRGYLALAWGAALVGDAERAERMGEIALHTAPDEALIRARLVWELAQMYAVSGNQRLAVQFLARSLQEPGGITAEMVRIHPLMEALQNSPVYQALEARGTGRPAGLVGEAQ
ncbi:MAG: hypothetical protein DHS20C11_11810 [Lysobacteraceae bacterium]|nr:MAG: hypothetical protein DHS20C11_11810 [Xanthomonadaceae bacterium]